jgi:Zn-dependent peptidase ImmA (M78 family)
VDQIAINMGAHLVRRSPIDFPYSGYFRDSTDTQHGKPVIEYNGSESFTRQRFTIAHELGHYVLQHGTSPRDSAQSFNAGTRDPRERAANQFAAEILMPADTVHHAVMRGYASTIEELAEMFGVSTLAMGYRLDNIGLLL